MAMEIRFTDNQWYNFICGFHAGLKLRDLSLPALDSSRLLYPIGVGGWGTIGIAMPKIKYDNSISSFLIPVFTHDVDIGYSGFSINIQWDSSRLRLDGVTEGQFGTIGNSSSSSDIRYTYSNGNFKARGIRDKAVVFNEPIILFYLNVTVIGTVDRNNSIKLKINENSFTNLDYTTLLKWVDIGSNQWYNYFITPLVNISGEIISDDLSTKDNNDRNTLGDETGTSVAGSKSGIYIGDAFTAPGDIGVVPIYANSNINDNFPFNGVHVNFTVNDNSELFKYIEVVGNDGFSLNVNTSTDSNGHMVFDVIATRDIAASDNVTFCYIQYEISNVDISSYVIPLINNISELMN